MSDNEEEKKKKPKLKLSNKGHKCKDVECNNGMCASKNDPQKR